MEPKAPLSGALDRHMAQSQESGKTAQRAMSFQKRMLHEHNISDLLLLGHLDKTESLEWSNLIHETVLNVFFIPIIF